MRKNTVVILSHNFIVNSEIQSPTQMLAEKSNPNINHWKYSKVIFLIPARFLAGYSNLRILITIHFAIKTTNLYRISNQYPTKLFFVVCVGMTHKEINPLPLFAPIKLVQNIYTLWTEFRRNVYICVCVSVHGFDRLHITPNVWVCQNIICIVNET
jgi:hypothetical protein